MQLSIVILNYNTKSMTSDCVHSVLNHVPQTLEFEVLIADNASTDGSFEFFEKEFSHVKQVRLFRNDENLGFAGGNNNLAKKSTAKYLLFLNSDTLLTDDKTIPALIDIMESDTSHDIGVLGCRLLNADGTQQTSCAKLPSILDVVGEYWFGRNFSHYNKPFLGVAEVETIIGAFMLMRRDTFLKIGLFNEEYFFNVEDVDLCFRLRKAGYRVMYVPEYQVTHFGGGSQADMKWWMNDALHLSRIKYFQLNRGRFGAWLAKIIIKSGIYARRRTH